MSIKDFIKQWGTRADLAGDLGVNTDAVHKWAQTGSIPAKYHLSVLRAAERRGFDADPMALIEMHASDNERAAR